MARVVPTEPGHVLSSMSVPYSATSYAHLGHTQAGSHPTSTSSLGEFAQSLETGSRHHRCPCRGQTPAREPPTLIRWPGGAGHSPSTFPGTQLHLRPPSLLEGGRPGRSRSCGQQSRGAEDRVRGTRSQVEEGRESGGGGRRTQHWGRGSPGPSGAETGDAGSPGPSGAEVSPAPRRVFCPDSRRWHNGPATR